MLEKSSFHRHMSGDCFYYFPVMTADFEGQHIITYCTYMMAFFQERPPTA